MSGPWKVSVDRDRCIGSGLCAGTAPDYFQLVDKKSTPLHDLVDPDEAVSDAADCCPVEAILITDTTTGDPVAPV